MAPTKKKLSAQEQRDAQKRAKQKKILMVLVPVLLIAVAMQIPRLLGGSEEAVPAETPAAEGAESGASAPPEGSAPAPVEPGDPLGVPGDPLADGGLGVAPAVGRLAEVADSDPAAPVEISELISFSTFIGDDPFVQLVQSPAQAPGSGGGGAGASGGASGDGGAAEPDAPDSLAILEINGEQEVVQVGGVFPADDPAFRLVSIDGQAAVAFGLVEGSFSTGIDTLDLETGKSITLVSQPDGFRFTIRLVQITTDAGAIEGLPPPPAR